MYGNNKNYGNSGNTNNNNQGNNNQQIYKNLVPFIPKFLRVILLV